MQLTRARFWRDFWLDTGLLLCALAIAAVIGVVRLAIWLVTRAIRVESAEER
jgi:hypothetical protein